MKREMMVKLNNYILSPSPKVVCLLFDATKGVVIMVTHYDYRLMIQGRVQDFGKGGSNISWFPKKRSSDFERGGSNGLKGGGVQYICLTRTTNFAYLDAKE